MNHAVRIALLALVLALAPAAASSSPSLRRGLADSNSETPPVIANCQSSFHFGKAPKAPFSFEAHKSDEWFRFSIASLADCHMDPKDCAHAYDFITHLAGACGSVTELEQKDAGPADVAAFLAALPTSKRLADTVNAHSPCIKDQPGGVDLFLQKYAGYVESWYAKV